jgi:anthranilate/para-aminobenzoate synthase component I
MSAAYRELLRSQGPCVLLESTSAPGPRARLSLLARCPRALLVSGPGGTRVARGQGAAELRPGDPLEVLRELLLEVPEGRWPEEGGVAGALAYDYARPGRPHAATPLLIALAVDRFLVFEDAPEPAAGPAPPPPAPRLDLPAHSSLTRDEYVALVLRVKEHIARGDIYQANLSQRFRVPAAVDGLALYAHLRRISPAPFAGYLRAGGLELVSSSPERLLSVEGRHASTRPIAGTRPRSADAGADRALAAELMLSEKERAEHLMLVDLARNDLGQVAEIGSVAVDELMAAEEYSHVRHIVSNVTARLARGRDALDALRALFPGGTITGVPKRRCMEILDALEPVPRGFYTGALFYITRSGRLDANILIRSAVVREGTVTFHAGGGIVADSDPLREYEETLHKAEAMRLALEAALWEGGTEERRHRDTEDTENGVIDWPPTTEEKG